MSEAELHVLRARLDGGIRNKAARGELRRGLPVGFVWGEDDGEILIHPDEAVSHVIRTIFVRFAELGSARRVWLWLRANDIKFPLRLGEHQDLRWSEASYHGVHAVLANPVYAGAYVYGKNRHETVLDETGARRKRVRKLPRDEWQVLIKDHHQGYIDWPTFEVNQQRMATNRQPRPHSDASRALCWCGSRRRSIASGYCPLWSLRTTVTHPLSRPQRSTRLSLCWQDHR